MSEFIKTAEDETNIYFESSYKGNIIRFQKNKQTNGISFNADDICRCKGIANSFNEFVGADRGLDFINEWKKNNPNDKPGVDPVYNNDFLLSFKEDEDLFYFILSIKQKVF